MYDMLLGYLCSIFVITVITLVIQLKDNKLYSVCAPGNFDAADIHCVSKNVHHLLISVKSNRF